METRTKKSYSLDELKDQFIGVIGSTDRDEYEYELSMDVIGRMIRSARQQRHLTQEQLGQLIGVQRAQISKLESSASSATIGTLVRVFSALQAEISFNVKLEGSYLRLR
jgi:HTH-type transcriptional regulator / antitoxin HipB